PCSFVALRINTEGVAVTNPSTALCGIPADSMPPITSKFNPAVAISSTKPSTTSRHSRGLNGNLRLSQYTGDTMPDLKVIGSLGWNLTPPIFSNAEAIVSLNPAPPSFH